MANTPEGMISRHHQRRPGSATQEAIRVAATELFTRKGFAATSVREIAAAAGVDPALVIRHFGSKESLFIDTVPSRNPFDGAFDGPVDGLGKRIAAHVVDQVDRESFSVYLEVLRASGSEAVRRRMGEMMDASFSQLRDRLSGTDALLRSRLVAAQVTGLLVYLAGARGSLSPADRRRGSLTVHL